MRLRLEVFRQKSCLAAHDDESFRMYDSCGIFVGIYRHAEGRLVPVKMFYDAGEAAGDN